MHIDFTDLPKYVDSWRSRTLEHFNIIANELDQTLLDFSIKSRNLTAENIIRQMNERFQDPYPLVFVAFHKFDKSKIPDYYLQEILNKTKIKKIAEDYANQFGMALDIKIYHNNKFEIIVKISFHFDEKYFEKATFNFNLSE